MVTEAIVMCVRTSATATKPHQGRSNRPSKSIRCLCLSSIADGPGGFYANHPPLQGQEKSRSCTFSRVPRAAVLQQPNIMARIGNFNPPDLEFFQYRDAQIRTHTLAAGLRNLDPKTELQLHPAFSHL